MLSEHGQETNLKSVYNPIEKWLKKVFRVKPAASEKSGADRRDFYRLAHDELQPLDLCLTMQDEQVFCTTVEDLSAGGFSCKLTEPAEIRCGELMSALFVLALEEPVIIRAKACLIPTEGNKSEKVFRFRFFDEMNDDDRELIHRYIVRKQFELLQNKKKWEDEEQPGPLTGE